MSLKVSEVFSSMQGEGPTAGVPAVFLRLTGCNLLCGGPGTQKDGDLHNGAKWRCDTIEVWLKGEPRPIDAVFTQEQENVLARGGHLIITGGEPMMQQEAIVEMIKFYRAKLRRAFIVEFETNGTVPLIPSLKFINLNFNVSPKLSNSGNEARKRLKPDVIKQFPRIQTVFKFVVACWEDWYEIKNEWLSQGLIDKDQIVLMPAGDSRDELDKTRELVAQLAHQETVRYTDRLHIVLWNQKTGV